MANSQSRLVGRLSGQSHFPRLDDQRMEGYKENGSSPSHYELLVGLARRKAANAKVINGEPLHDDWSSQRLVQASRSRCGVLGSGEVPNLWVPARRPELGQFGSSQRRRLNASGIRSFRERHCNAPGHSDAYLSGDSAPNDCAMIGADRQSSRDRAFCLQFFLFLMKPWVCTIRNGVESPAMFVCCSAYPLQNDGSAICAYFAVTHRWRLASSCQARTIV